MSAASLSPPSAFVSPASAGISSFAITPFSARISNKVMIDFVSDVRELCKIITEHQVHRS